MGYAPSALTHPTGWRRWRRRRRCGFGLQQSRQQRFRRSRSRRRRWRQNLRRGRRQTQRQRRQRRTRSSYDFLAVIVGSARSCQFYQEPQPERSEAKSGLRTTACPTPPAPPFAACGGSAAPAARSDSFVNGRQPMYTAGVNGCSPGGSAAEERVHANGVLRGSRERRGVGGIGRRRCRRRGRHDRDRRRRCRGRYPGRRGHRRGRMGAPSGSARRLDRGPAHWPTSLEECSSALSKRPGTWCTPARMRHAGWERSPPVRCGWTCPAYFREWPSSTSGWRDSLLAFVRLATGGYIIGAIVRLFERDALHQFIDGLLQHAFGGDPSARLASARTRVRLNRSDFGLRVGMTFHTVFFDSASSDLAALHSCGHINLYALARARPVCLWHAPLASDRRDERGCARQRLVDAHQPFHHRSPHRERGP